MSHTIELSDEQLEELAMMLRRELRESKGELRHTWDAHYKQRVRRHIDLIERTVRDFDLLRHSNAPDSIAH